jgi:type I restriction enzyme M protein
MIMPLGRPASKNGKGKMLGSQQSVDQAIKSICDIMRRGNCAGAMQYMPELTWILFLRILDERKEIETAPANSLFDFVNTKLLPLLRKLGEQPSATARQKVISQIMSGLERVRIDTERNLLDVLDKVHELTGEAVDTTHVFALSQVYEGLLLKMGEKGNNGGQFFTPRQAWKRARWAASYASAARRGARARPASAGRLIDLARLTSV